MVNNINEIQVGGGGTLKGILTTFFTTSLLLFSGCSSSGSSSSSSEENTNAEVNTTQELDLSIKSAVYDDKATLTVLDDELYVYFTKSIDPNSIAVDTSANYVLYGTGAIGTASLSDYNDTTFHRHLIKLNNDGSASTALVTNDTNISLAPSIITDEDGNYPNDYNKTTLEKFNVFSRIKTGQTTSYIANDDGDYQMEVSRSYTDNGDTVQDNATGLIWQQEDDNTTRTWADAQTYCSGITLDAYSNFRLPTIEELVSITDKSRTNPAIDPIFTNTNSGDRDFYWSITTFMVDTDSAWTTYSFFGTDGTSDKTNTHYVRCVSSGDSNTAPTWTQASYSTGIIVDDTTDTAQIIKDLTAVSSDADDDLITYRIISITIANPGEQTAWNNSVVIQSGVLKVQNLAVNDPDTSGTIIVKVRATSIGGSSDTNVVFAFNNTH